MSHAAFLYRLSRSSASLENVGACLSIASRHAVGVYAHTRPKSGVASERTDSLVQHSGGAKRKESPATTPAPLDAASEDNQPVSPILQAHLESLQPPSGAQGKNTRTGKRVEPKAEDGASTPQPITTNAEAQVGASKRPAPATFSSRPRAFPGLVFDEATVAKVATPPEATQQWTPEREAHVAQAAARLQGGPDLGVLPGHQDHSTTEAGTTPHMEPKRIEDLAPELRPHFRVITRKRPNPVRVADIWEKVRAADKTGKRAAANAFKPSVDCSISLLIDPRRSDHLVRGTVSLPHGTGRDAKVAVFTSSASDASAAQAAGAALVGGEDLVTKVAENKGITADAVIATPDMVPKLGKIARILGPRGLMPNPKFGTVTTQVADTVKELRRGKLQFRNDKGGTLSVSIGRKSFTDEQLTENFFSLMQAVMDLRPKGLAGNDINGYVERVSVSTTQGKGFPVSMEDITASARAEHVRG